MFVNHAYITAQDLVRKLLTVKPEDRITCDEAFQHPWMQVRKLCDMMLLLSFARL